MARQGGKTWCGWNYTGFRRRDISKDYAKKHNIPMMEVFDHLKLNVVSYERCDCKNCLKAFHAFARSIIENNQVDAFMTVLVVENRKLEEAKEAAE